MKIDKMEQARREGMGYALQVARKDGLDALEREIRLRGAWNIPIGVKRKSAEEWIQQTKEEILATALTVALVSLHDEFKFGHDRLERFVKKFNGNIDCVYKDLCSWQEFAGILADECGIEMKFKDTRESHQNAV